MDELQTIYQDPWILVVGKPSGMPTQSTRDGQPGVYEHLKASLDTVALHHRLDQPASGLLVFGLHPHVNRPLTEAFRNHQIQRTYLAILGGQVTATEWTQPVHGKAAHTTVQALGSQDGLTAVQLELHTGRKHQIRLHAAMQEAPIVGDRRYGGDWSHQWPRLALHAWRLRLNHPVTGNELIFTSPLPTDLEELWQMTGAPPPQMTGAPPPEPPPST